VESYDTGKITFYIYRPKTVFKTDAAGIPDFNDDTKAFSFGERKPVYKSPMKVAQPCIRGRSFDGILSTSCPNEPEFSGNLEVANIVL